MKRPDLGAEDFSPWWSVLALLAGLLLGFVTLILPMLLLTR